MLSKKSWMRTMDGRERAEWGIGGGRALLGEARVLYVELLVRFRQPP
jgi:hypothetical protein